MAAITGTLVGNTEFGGAHKIITVTAPIGAASDTVTLTAAAHGGVKSIVAILGVVMTGGVDADFMQVMATFSGLVITLVSKQGDGAAADEFTGTTVSLSILVKCEE